MKSILFLLIGAFALPTYAVDTVKVNKVVAEILNEIAAKDDFVETLEISLDADKTDLSKPALGASVSASTKGAAWSVNTTALAATLVIDSTPLGDGVTEVSASLQMELDTDVYALTQYVAKKDICIDLDFGSKGDSPACKTMIEELVAAKTFEEQVRSVAKAFEAFKVEIAARIAVLEDEDPSNYEIVDLKETLEMFEAVVFTENEGGLTVEADFEDLFLGGDLAVYVSVSDSNVTVILAFDFPMGEEELRSFTMFPAQILSILESDTAESKEYVSGFAEAYIDFLKAMVTED